MIHILPRKPYEAVVCDLNDLNELETFIKPTHAVVLNATATACCIFPVNSPHSHHLHLLVNHKDVIMKCHGDLFHIPYKNLIDYDLINIGIESPADDMISKRFLETK
jgi:hypothetical protein